MLRRSRRFGHGLCSGSRIGDIRTCFCSVFVQNCRFQAVFVRGFRGSCDQAVITRLGFHPIRRRLGFCNSFSYRRNLGLDRVGFCCSSLCYVFFGQRFSFRSFCFHSFCFDDGRELAVDLRCSHVCFTRNLCNRFRNSFGFRLYGFSARLGFGCHGTCPASTRDHRSGRRDIGRTHFFLRRVSGHVRPAADT